MSEHSAVLRNFDGGPYDIREPRSVYDRFQEPKRPFGWATPAQNMDGSYPLPWRVGKRDSALALVKSLGFKDAYVVNARKWQGKERLSVGLRGRYSDEEKAAALTDIANALQAKGAKAVADLRDGAVYLLDDLKRDVLRRASLRSATIRFAASLGQGDPARRELLALVNTRTAGNRDWAKLFPRNSYLNLFFAEKDIRSKMFDITDSRGVAHSIPNDVVVEAIAQTSGSERKKIEDTIRQLDFRNADINHFLEHLAKGLAEQYAGVMRFATED